MPSHPSFLISALFDIALLTAVPSVASSAPAGFPESGNGLWYQSIGGVWSREWLPVGNGFLAATLPGGTAFESTQLNIESLWSGGPFEDPSYNGGNKPSSERANMTREMQRIRNTIFKDGTIDDVDALTSDNGAYGSYAGAGYLLSTIHLDSKQKPSNYSRWLDMDQAFARTRWSQSETNIERTSFCSHSVRACAEHLSVASNSSNFTLPNVTYAFSPFLETSFPTPDVSCLDERTLRVQGVVNEPGMAYEFLIRGNAIGDNATVSCTQLTSSSSSPNATLTINGATESWVLWTGDTDYDMNAGDEAHGFSFKRSDGVPHSDLVAVLNASSSSSFAPLLRGHVEAYKAHLGPFSLSLSQTPDLTRTTDDLISSYKRDTGSTYVEWLLFQYGRYLLASSAPGVLPTNLQGKWANGLGNAWGADYHSNINIQMNYWFAEMTGMDSVVGPLFDYVEKTWAPRGAYTAQVLYNITEGWVTHDEMNIFGHTGMKAAGTSAQAADYPESNAWIMIHTWDHFDYTGDVSWWKAQGWPLLKSVASFHLAKLVPDRHFNDSTLVVAPCNSPEQAPITLGCAHAQQLIWQLFNAVEKGSAAAGDGDSAFLEEIRSKRAQMDKGIHVGSWGQLQEWKVDMDDPKDTHRHLSHLVGLYPGYALSSYDPSIQGPPQSSTKSKALTKAEVLNATKTSLIHRGDGTASDADSGWEKVWRAAAWAQLGDADKFYDELSYAIDRNFGANLFSLYSPFDADPIFQIDANLGYPAALLNALVQAPDVASLSTPLTITLLPALPSTWPQGSLSGVRVRGGIRLDIAWDGGKLTKATAVMDRDHVNVNRNIQVVYDGKTLKTFKGTKGNTVIIL